MKKPKKDTLVRRLQDIATEIDKISKTAGKHRKSLSCDNYYGNKFDELRSILIHLKKELKLTVESIGRPELKKEIDSLESYFESLIDPSTSQSNRSSAKKQFIFILHSQIEPFIEKNNITKIPTVDTVIPMDIVKRTRGYIEKIAIQANGCYESGWFDACAVMIRRLVETLIIECFEHHNIQMKIKDNNGNYFHLKALIDICLKESSWTLSRNTKSSLPNLKDIGDLSAHNRRYLATKSDIDKICVGARVVIEELVHLSKLKN